jgi:hypothetical protein
VIFAVVGADRKRSRRRKVKPCLSNVTPLCHRSRPFIEQRSTSPVEVDAVDRNQFAANPIDPLDFPGMHGRRRLRGGEVTEMLFASAWWHGGGSASRMPDPFESLSECKECVGGFDAPRWCDYFRGHVGPLDCTGQPERSAILLARSVEVRGKAVLRHHMLFDRHATRKAASGWSTACRTVVKSVTRTPQ